MYREGAAIPSTPSENVSGFNNSEGASQPECGEMMLHSHIVAVYGID